MSFTFLQPLTQPENQKLVFYGGQALIVAVILILWLLRQKPPESGFRVREADLQKAKTSPHAPRQLAHARIIKKGPLQLEGISITGEPHEILGVPENATASQIQSAYRELMKKYHPDLVGRPGSREWSDAQKIAEAVNRAKDQLLKAVRK